MLLFVIYIQYTSVSIVQAYKFSCYYWQKQRKLPFNITEAQKERGEKMKKFFSLLVAVVVMMCLSVSALALEEEPPVPVEPDDPYMYTQTISSRLNISSNTATCVSKVIGISGIATKIEITQTLQQTFGGISWYYVDSWNRTYYSTTAVFTNTKSPIGSGNYRVKTEAKVYCGSSYETIISYSTTVTV